MLRLRHSQSLQRQLPQRQPLQQRPVWNGVKNGALRGALVVRSDVKRDAPVVWSDVRRDAPLARSDVKRGEPLASSDVRHGADCTCSPTSPQNNNSNHHQQRMAHRAQNSVGLLFLAMQKSGSFATFAAIRLASSRVSNLAADRRSGSSSK